MNWFVRFEIRKEISQTDSENAGEVRQVLVFDAMALAFNLGDHLPCDIEPFQLKLNGELRLRPSTMVTQSSDLRPH